jgi:hypothetical protein
MVPLVMSKSSHYCFFCDLPSGAKAKSIVVEMRRLMWHCVPALVRAIFDPPFAVFFFEPLL